MGNYFLVARNKGNNSFLIIGINEKWYLGDKGQDVVWYGSSLEAIDLVTSSFKSKEQMIERLFACGYITDKNVDIFVANRTKIDGKDYVLFDEVIYNSGNKNRMNNFKQVARASLASDFDSVHDQVDYICDEISQLTYSCDDVYRMIIDGDSNIPRNFADLFRGLPLYEGYLENIRVDFNLKPEDYYTVRSIVEMLNRIDDLSTCIKDDRAYENDKFISENFESRKSLIFNLIVELNNRGLKLADKSSDLKSESVESKNTFEPIKLPKSTLSIEEKKKEVFTMVKTFPKNMFSSVIDGYEMNYSLFESPLYDEEKEKLESLLTGNMPRFFRNYLIYRERLDEARKGFPSPSEISDLQDEIERNKNSIYKRFKSEKCVNQTYEWCRLYEACRQRDASYSSMGEEVSTGDTNAKVYSKK